MLHDVYTVSMPAVRYIWCVCICVCVCVPWFLQLLLVLLCGGSRVIVYIKCSRKTHQPPSQSLPLAPLYDDIKLPTTTNHEAELEQNVACGYLN